VNPEKEFPLKNFTGRNDFASKAVAMAKEQCSSTC